MGDYSNSLILYDQSIKRALEMLNNLPLSLTLFVQDDHNKIIGTCTDGDVRRGLIGGKTINDPVSSIMCEDFKYLVLNKFNLDEIVELKKSNIRLVPLLDNEKKLIKVVDLYKFRSLLPLDVLIMAGGKGERLKPLTDKTPKPLLKVGAKPIIEHNIDRLISFGIQNIKISINYLGEQLIEHFQGGKNKGVTIEFVREETPMGTIGAITLSQGFEKDYILLMNSDLLTNIDFEDFFRHFLSENADLAVATIPYKVNIPYAVLETDGDDVLSLKEKPTYTYYSNAGIYLLKKEALSFIPKNQYYDATDFIEKLIEAGKKVVSYPILGYWLDIGRLEDYQKAQEDIKHLTL